MNVGMVAHAIEIPETVEIERAEPARSDTTLFDLIATLQEAAEPQDDAAVIAAVTELAQTGRIQFRAPVDISHYPKSRAWKSSQTKHWDDR
jgi:hypothetical protein